MPKVPPASPCTLAAIDAGSNGIRLVIAEAREDGSLVEILSQRVALRLGRDAFGAGRFSPRTMDRAVDVFRGFRDQLDAHDARILRAVATSATRSSENGEELALRVGEETGIHLEIIGGLEEAQLIVGAVAGAVKLHERVALLIDMGGGSVEVTILEDGRASACETLRLGPVRLLERMAADGRTDEDVTDLLDEFGGRVEELIHSELGDARPQIAVATGGNVERLAKLRLTLGGKRKSGKVKIGDLELIIPALFETSIEERIVAMGMRPDRADLIAIAAQVLHMILDEASVSKVLVPGVSLKEGILRDVARRVYEGVPPVPVRLEPVTPVVPPIARSG